MTSAKESDDAIRPLIRNIRGQRVILDFDLAGIYEVQTHVFNQAFKRNRSRFPFDFCFRLTASEFASLKSKEMMGSAQFIVGSRIAPISSQIVMSFRTRRGAAYRPWAFTEHGALMAANILRSPRARKISIFVIRAFMRMREELAANATILKRLAEIDRTLLVHDSALRDVYQKLLPLLKPPAELPKPKIGFHAGNR